MMQHLTTDTLIDFIHGELPAAEDALVHAHLQTCGSCRAEFEHESALSDALRAAVRSEERELPGIVRARIWDALRTERPSVAMRFAAILRPAIAFPAAAALLLVTYFAIPFGHTPSSVRTVDAMYYFEQHAAEEMQSPLAERNVSSTILETSDVAPAPTVGTGRTVAAAVDAVE